jgi:5-methylcytosine-specific restriction endonuclease McrA
VSPYAPWRPCAGGCGRLVPKGRCPACRRRVEQARGTPSARGYGAAHQAMRARVFREEPDCRRCGAEGQASDHLDHIVPRSRGGTNARANYQRLCKTCNVQKRHEDARR